MTDSPTETLRQIAGMPKEDRYAQKDELQKRYGSTLTSPLHKQILDCLVGEPCKSLAARSWASMLIREATEGESSE